MPVTAESAQFRLTPQRAAVLRAVQASTDHPTARDLYRRVKDTVPGIGFATVYRALALLVRHGRVLELQFGDEPVARYDGNTRRHDHVRCTGCGMIADLHVPLPEGLAQEAARRSGFDVAGYELCFRGRCPHCRG